MEIVWALFVGNNNKGEGPLEGYSTGNSKWLRLVAKDLLAAFTTGFTITFSQVAASQLSIKNLSVAVPV